jgi:cytochrome c oxidase subunit 2
MKRSCPTFFAALICLPLLNGCSGNQSSLNPAGYQARQTGDLWWLFCIILTVIYALVLLFLFVALARRGRSTSTEPILFPDPKRERRMGWTVGSFVGVTVIILFVFLVTDFATGKSNRDLGDPHPLRIKIKGHQWWWEVNYLSDVASNQLTTANEIHVPVGKAVQFDLQAADVIHSFWAPNFSGKKDLIPGHPTRLWFRVERAGVFIGQCAEFCGAQHAHMRFVVVSETPEEFARWYQAQQQTPPPLADDWQKRGQQLLLSSTCVMCHTIQGTPARGTVGPNLTHLASRRMLAAGTVTNTLGHLAGWIIDPQKIKPGVLMPQHSFSPEDLRALLAYLETLK